MAGAYPGKGPHIRIALAARNLLGENNEDQESVVSGTLGGNNEDQELVVLGPTRSTVVSSTRAASYVCPHCVQEQVQSGDVARDADGPDAEAAVAPVFACAACEAKRYHAFSKLRNRHRART